MSSNLGWMPVESDWRFLGDQLKFALRKGYGEPVDAVLNSEDIPYLKGLADAGVKDADKLIEAIEKHDELRVKEVF